MNKKYDNRPIDLLDIFWDIVFAWRSLLAWMLVFMLLMTGYAGLRYYTGIQSYDAAMAEYQEARKGKATSAKKEQETDTEFTKEQRTQIKDALATRKLLEKSRKYMDESILMNIDPYAENMLTVHFYVDTGYTFNYTKDNTSDYTDSLIDAYVDYINSGEVAQAMLDELKLDTDVRYIGELLSATRESDEGGSDNGFTVRMIYMDDSIFEAAESVIEQSIESKQKLFADKIGTHTIDVVSSDTAVVADSDTADRQATVMGNLNNYRTQYSTLASALDEAQMAEVDAGIQELNGEVNEEDIEEPVKPSFSFKYPVLGAILGLFLACIWIALKEIFSNRLAHAQELGLYFELDQIGVLHAKRNGRTENRIDKMLRRVRYRNQKEIDNDTRLGIVCGNLELTCKREGLTRVCLTGTEIEKLQRTDETLLHTIVDRLSKVGIEVTPVDNICYDMAAMRTVAEVGAVVLVEQTGESIFQEIDRELMLLKQSEINVVGAIGVE